MGMGSLPQPDHILAYWKMDDASGNLVDEKDTWPMGPVGNPTYGHEGKVGDCIYLAGDGYFQSGSVGTSTTLTVCGWVKFNRAGGGWHAHTHLSIRRTRPLLYYVDRPNNEGFGIYWDGASGAFGPGGQYSGKYTHSFGVWHHWAVAFGGNCYALYLDGVLRESHAMTLSAPTASYTRLGMYWSDASTMMIGYEDESIIWNVTLSTAEVQQVYGLGYAKKSAAFIL